MQRAGSCIWERGGHHLEAPGGNYRVDRLGNADLHQAGSAARGAHRGEPRRAGESARPCDHDDATERPLVPVLRAIGEHEALR